MKRHATLFAIALFAAGCGTLSKPLLDGTASYANQKPPSASEQSGKSEPFETEALGCFANSESATELEVIAPAVQKLLSEKNALRAENVKARRQIAPTVIDSIFGGFIWSCSYWTLTGDLVY